jgi:RimJ/RimL family protein N-acetyltransferase
VSGPTVRAGSFGPQPVLAAAPDLVLRPWQPADAATFLRAYEDPAIRHWHPRRPASEDEVRDWFDRYRHDWAAEKGAS